MAAWVSDEAKERLRRIGDGARTVLQFGLLPLVLYLGTRAPAPRESRARQCRCGFRKKEGKGRRARRRFDGHGDPLSAETSRVEWTERAQNRQF